MRVGVARLPGDETQEAKVSECLTTEDLMRAIGRANAGDSPLLGGVPAPPHTCTAAPPPPIHWLDRPPVRRAPAARPPPGAAPLSAGATPPVPLYQAAGHLPRTEPPANPLPAPGRPPRV
jgi:hypothetical protein